MDPAELQRRLATLKQFKDNLADRYKIMQNIMDTIGWSWKDTPTTADSMVECPINSEHKIPSLKIDSHLELCKFKQQGYNKTDLLYPELGCSVPDTQTIKMDESTQMEIINKSQIESNFTLDVKSEFRGISQSIERYVCDFTPDERRVLYDYAVQNTKGPNCNIADNVLHNDTFNKTDNEKTKTELELLQEQRDAKRRRVAYRGKRVHTDRKSYLEVLKEVIDGQINSMTCHEDQQTNCGNWQETNVEPTNSDRVHYKYEGSKFFSGNPYTRWITIEKEESKLFDYLKNKSNDSFTPASSSEKNSKEISTSQTILHRRSISSSISNQHKKEDSRYKFYSEWSDSKKKDNQSMSHNESLELALPCNKNCNAYSESIHTKHKHNKKTKRSRSHKVTHSSRSREPSSHGSRSRRSSSKSHRSRSRSNHYETKNKDTKSSKKKQKKEIQAF
ncbi:U11/U12 small nuclear ribonucleoprotein 48 kDa protein-like isoform X2 [Adelges cooleyi]|uniref:U11/U12 small nuclear ribonucleoprotein 48 kDa protein-like isoform X2 n=1 Tax=Adelges cooleyi TaxID=133065 RepID=UPI00218012B2|nr:U11/U12 small nuclear ribonucleoprotein 48 kDa protein-like isoform X2 [Adelges cooleyi]